MIDLGSARAAIAARIAPAGAAVEHLALADAYGRVLANPLRAPRDIPGFAHAAMDGYALRGADLRADAPTRLRLSGVLLAGGELPAALAAGECLRIMTGAPLPAGADTVVIREHARESAGQVELAAGTPLGANVRAADDDFAAGTAALAAGATLDATALAVLASFGVDRVAVRARPRVAVLVTGDELAPPGAVLRAGQRYDSNRHLLSALLAEVGAQVSPVQQLRDDEALLERALLDAAAAADFVVTTGGASAGDADYLPALLAKTGERVFWKVAMKPGMPAFFGFVGGTPVFGLPGNPVSVFATFIALLRPALARWLGAPGLDPPALWARLETAVDKRHARFEYRRARLRIDDEGVLRVAVHPSTSSGALRSVLESDALAEFDSAPRDWQAGERVRVHRVRGVGP